jgi:CRISPR-associated protein Csm5
MIPAVMPLRAQDLFEKQALDLRVVSPVHIGTKEGALSALEFAVHEGRTYIVDEEKLGLFLKDHGLVDSFVEAARRGPIKLKEFIGLKKGGSISPALREISRYSVPGGLDHIQEFRPFVRDGKGQVYLPGTAIKGVFRTAFLYKMLLDDQRLKEKVSGEAESNLSKLQGPRKEREKKGYSSKWLQSDLLEKYSLSNAKKGPNTDILRCLKISDAYPTAGCETRVIKIRFLSKRSGNDFYWSKKKRGLSSTEHDLEIWVEALTSGAFRTELVWDKVLFDRFRRENPNQKWPAEGIDGLLSLLFKMSKDVIQHEIGFFNTSGSRTFRGTGRDPEEAARGMGFFYDKIPGKVMRIGFGSGMLSTTVNLHFPNELRQKIRDACGYPRSNDPAPKSRRVWEIGNGQWRPMGWVAFGDSAMAGSGEMQLNLSSAQRQGGQTLHDPQKQWTQDKPGRPFGRPHVQSRPVQDDAEQQNWADLKRRLDLMQPNDKLGLDRTIKAIERLDNSEERKAAAAYLKRKLEKGGLWKKNPLRADIEMLLLDDADDN